MSRSSQSTGSKRIVSESSAVRTSLDPNDEGAPISSCTNSSPTRKTDYGTGSLTDVNGDDTGVNNLDHGHHRRHNRKDHLSSSLRTVSTLGTTTTVATARLKNDIYNNNFTTHPGRVVGIKRLILALTLVMCSYVGFYTVFVLWTHHNHPYGVFGEPPQPSSSSSSTTSNVDHHPTDDHHNDVRQKNQPVPPTNFLFGNLGSILMGQAASNAQPPNSHPVPRSILLMLHGEAVPANDYVMLDDDRPLTASGIQQSERLGLFLQEHNIAQPDWIFCSPSVRTSYTLELVRRHWASTVPVAFESILYTLAFNDYFAFVAGLNHNFRRVLIVGHNPAILNTAKKLMKVHGIEDFPQAGFLELTWEDQPLWYNIFPGTANVKIAVSGGDGNDFFDEMY